MRRVYTILLVPTVDQLLTEARTRLAAAPFQPPRREAGLLLGFVLGKSEAWIQARGEVDVPSASTARFRALLERRLAGEPMAYLKGEREFYGRDFRVDARVLIPRPETEHLVEAVLAWPGIRQAAEPRILDVGTGSGCIAVTLAAELPRARVVATDLSPAALAVARCNARRHGVVERVALVAADLVAPLRAVAFDLVVSNPPYVDPADASTLSVEVTGFEPSPALYADGGGLAVVERLLEAAAGLPAGAGLFLEIGQGQGEAVATAARERGFGVERIVEDYAGIPRTVVLQR